MLLEGNDFGTKEFRRGVWHQTTSTVTLLTSAADDRENVMACEWTMMVSFNPMRFVISISPDNVTHEFIDKTQEFGLNFCSDQQAKLSHTAGSHSLRDVNKWELAGFQKYPAKKIKAPMIEGCILNVECKVVQKITFEAHTLFVGEALWAKYDPEKKPILYYKGKYWHLGANVPKE
jgi:flavin reductase (DIM6/NTAB) family NADH-FMN oxidoreductase RutF